MSVPEIEARRVIVESGLAAVNHGLCEEARAIRASLCDLVVSPAPRRLLEATLLIGLGEPDQAARLLEDDRSAEAETLRKLLFRNSGQRPLREAHFSPHLRDTKDTRHGH